MNNTTGKIDTSKIQFVDEDNEHGPSAHERSEIRRYIDLLQTDGKLAAPMNRVVTEYVFCAYGGVLDAVLDDGTHLSTMGACGIVDEWCYSDDRLEGNYPKTTDGVGFQAWFGPYGG